MMSRKNHLRSKLNPNMFAGTGMVRPPEWEDDYKKSRGIKVHRAGMLPTDRFGSGKKGKKAFDEYCKSQSGEMKVYNMKDLEKTPE